MEYVLYCSVMTTGSIVLGLANILGFDEEGKRRTPVMDQPISESLREARLELKEYQDRKALQWKTWFYQKGYGSWWSSVFGPKNTNKQPQQDYLKEALQEDAGPGKK